MASEDLEYSTQVTLTSFMVLVVISSELIIHILLKFLLLKDYIDAGLEQHEGRVNIPILTELEWFL